jgi:cobalt/nickel transport system permease protein
MMRKTERCIYELGKMETISGGNGVVNRIDPRGKLTVTLVFLICVLTVPPTSVGTLLSLNLYTITFCLLCGTSYIDVVRRSLIVLPFVIFIGLFNTIFGNREIITVFGVDVDSGWCSFLSLTLRSMLAAQAVIILLLTTGFRGVCLALISLKVPSLLVTQLMFLYRYLFIILSETLSTERAVKSRGYGKSAYPLKLWSRMIGQLLLRSFDRAERIDMAIRSRCYAGRIIYPDKLTWLKTDTLFVTLCSLAIAAIRLCPF